MRGRRKCSIIENNHILPPSGNGDLLSHTISYKLDIVFKVFRLVLIGRVKTALDEDIYTILAPDLNVMEFITFHSINIKEEMAITLACHPDRRNVKHLLALVIDQKLLGGRALACNYGIEFHCIGREREHIAGAC